MKFATACSALASESARSGGRASVPEPISFWLLRCADIDLIQAEADADNGVLFAGGDAA